MFREISGSTIKGVLPPADLFNALSGHNAEVSGHEMRWVSSSCGDEKSMALSLEADSRVDWLKTMATSVYSTFYRGRSLPFVTGIVSARL